MPLDDEKTVAELAKEINDKFSAKLDEVKEIAEKAISEAEKGTKSSNSANEKTDETLNELNSLKSILDELQQKGLRQGGDATGAQKSVGAQFVESESFKAFQANPRKGDSAELLIKADLTTATGGAGGMGAAVHANHLPGIKPLPQRRMTVRSLLMPGQTDLPLIDYDRETGFTNNAAPTAEGALKPQSTFEIEEVQTRTKVIAHWIRVSKQTLSDVSQIRSTIDNRLLYGLDFKEELQLLFGDNTGENLHGIVPQATAYAAPNGVDDSSVIDKLRLMALQAVLAEYPSTGFVLNPIDWAAIELLKDTTGRYIIGNPQGSLSPTLWGLPVVETPAMTPDKALAGAFDMGAQVFDQWSSRIETGYQNDDFTRNKVTILAEERLALAVYRPEAFIFGDLGRIA